MWDILFSAIAFILQTIVYVAASLFVIAGIIVIVKKLCMKEKTGDEGKITISHLNNHYRNMAEGLKEALVSDSDKDKKEKPEKKEKKAEKPAEKKKQEQAPKKPRMFVLNFIGDVEASAVSHLREEITAILAIAASADEVLLHLESGGGYVHSYGLAAAQLTRLRDKKIKLTITVDEVAASGGYMMACVANKIIAAPFAIVGSIGVIAGMPNVHELLKKHGIQYEQATGGRYKRTLNFYTPNTPEGVKKFKADVERTHQFFRELVKRNRPQLNMRKVATGECWYGQQALEKKLIDKIATSDEYLYGLKDAYELYRLEYKPKQNSLEKLREEFASLCVLVLKKVFFSVHKLINH